MLEQVLLDGPYALGPFTVADCALAPVLFRTTKSGLDLAPYPKLRALRDVLLARPAFQAAGPVT
jgi:glutathione S-transferase